MVRQKLLKKKQSDSVFYAFLLGSAVVFNAACVSINTVQIDRPTVAEMESAGDWPDFEKKLLKSSVHSGATFIPENEESRKRKKTTELLSGEFAGKSKSESLR